MKRLITLFFLWLGTLNGWAQAPTPAQMGITTVDPNAVQIRDSSGTWTTLGTINPTTHVFTPANLPPPYALPIASTTVLGGVKVDGTTITVTGGGVISGTPAGVNANTTSTSGFAAGRMMFSDGAKVQVAPAIATAASSTDINAQLMLLPDAGSGYHGTVVSPAGVFIGNFGTLGFTYNGYAGLTDTGIGRADSNTLGLWNNGGADFTAGTAFRAYNLLHDFSNSEWGGFDWKTVPNTLTIGTAANGTGTQRPVNIVGSSVTVNGNAPLTNITANSTPTSGLNNYELLYSDGTKVQSSGGTSELVLSSGIVAALSYPVLGLSVNTSGFGAATFGFLVNKGWMTAGDGYGYVAPGGWVFDDPDTATFRPAVATLGVWDHRATTTATAFNVYNTFTDGANGEWGTLDWKTVPNTLTIGARANGTGTLRAVNIVGSNLEINGVVAVSCAAGTVSLTTMVVTNGIITHC